MLNLPSNIANKTVSVLAACAIAFSPVSPVLAQSGDAEAPVVIHRQLDSGIAGELQTFLARVSDDFGVEDVVLYYRQADTGEFQRLPMRPLLDSIGEYMIAVETIPNAYPGLQYYIEAVDAAGNTTNRGFSYAPIVIPLTEQIATAPTAADASVTETTSNADSGSFELSPTVVLVGLGALLAVGALVGASGGSDDDGETENPVTPTTPSGPDTVTLTIVSDLPSTN